jgi:hypothetical protein
VTGIKSRFRHRIEQLNQRSEHDVHRPRDCHEDAEGASDDDRERKAGAGAIERRQPVGDKLARLDEFDPGLRHIGQRRQRQRRHQMQTRRSLPCQSQDEQRRIPNEEIRR